MRRSQNDTSDTSRPLRNLVTNPELVADVSDRLLFRNAVTNPSFEAASGTTTVRTNLSTNPGFDTSSGPVTVRTNLATNPGFESTGADTNVNYNLVPYPSFELSSGTATVRTNISTNPGMESAGVPVVVRSNRAVNPGFEADSGTVTVRSNSVNNPSLAVNATGWTTYGGSPTHPSLITSRTGATWSTSGYAWKVEGTANSLPYMAELGVGDFTLGAGVPISVSINVIASSTRRARIRLRFLGSGGDYWTPDFWLNSSAPTRMSFSMTAPAGATGVSFNVKEGSGTADPFLAGDWIAGSMAMVEINTLTPGPYFDGSTPNTNLITNSNFEVNGTGWWPNTGSPTLTTSSEQAFLGTKSLKAVTTLATADNAVTYTVPGLKAGQTYTLSYYVYSMDARTNAYFDVAATNFNAAAQGQRAIPAQTWTRVSGTFTISPTMTGDTAFYLHHAGGPATTGTIVHIDAVLLEKADFVNPYFDGQGDMTYSWAATAHASTSYERAPGVANILTTLSGNGGAVSKVYQTAIGRNGKGLKITKRGGYAYFDYNLTGLTSGASYTFSYDVLTDQTKIDTVDRGTAAASIYAPSQKTVTPHVWNRVSRTIVVGAGETTRNLSIAGWENATVPDGAWMIVDNFLIEETTAVLPYFDGATSAADGLTYIWTGTANASTSEQKGVTAAENTYVTGNTVPWQSTARYRSGTKSLATLIKVALADHATIRYPSTEYTVGNGAGQLLPSTVYTWSMYVWIPAGGGAVKLFDVTTNSTGTPSTLTNQWERISLTFTTPASGTLFLRLRTHGAMASGTTVWIDEELLEAANATRPYFDGSSQLQNLVTNPSVEVNTTGYTPKGSTSPTLSRDTTKSYLGTASIKTTFTSNTAVQGVGYTVSGLTIGTQYTMSGYIYVPAGNIDVISTVSNVGYGTSTGGVRDSWVRLVMTWTATATSHVIGFDSTGFSQVDKLFYLDALMLTATSTVTDYFEGQGDLTYAWTGVTGASTSTVTAPNVAGWAQLGSLYRSTFDPKVGTYSAALLTRGLNGDGLWPGTNLDVFGGRKYWFSAWIKTTSVHGLTVAFRWSDASFVSTGADTNVTVTSQLTVGQWSYVTASAVAPANTAKLQMMTRIYESHVPTTFYMDGAMVVESDTPVPYFDGSTPASGDFNYSWAGAANASVSRQRGASINDLLSYSAIAVSSSAWKASGSKSARVVSTITTANDTFVSLTGDTGAMRNGFVAGKTYTVSATCRLEAPLTGTLSLRSRKIVFFHRAGGTGNYTEVGSTQAPNVAGETRVSMTFTIPADATEGFIRLYNGSYAGNGDVWWDNLLIEETTYLKPYFDGNTPSVENLAKDTPVAFSNTTHTAGVSYGGSTWTRSSVPANGSSLTRQYVNNYFLVSGETYTTSVTVANDQSTPQQITFDWCDVGSVTHTLAPGEIKRITTSGVRPMSSTYGTTYRFSDIHVTPSATEARSILFKDWLVELGTTSGEYYTGTGDFNFAWTGTANASTSVMTATGLSNLSAAWNAVCYRTGTVGNYRGRVMFTSGTITDSGLAFGMVSTLAPSKVYTVSVDITSDTSRNVRFSSQGTGTVMSNPAAIPLTAGVKTRQSFTFTTTATAPAGVSLYILRNDLLPGTIEFDNMLIEEAPFAAPYFDGSTPDKKNLAVNPNLEVNSFGWATNDGTLYPAVRSTVSPISGTASFRVTRAATNLNTAAASIYANGHPATELLGLKVTPGETYTFSMDVFTSQANRRTNTYLTFRNASGMGLGSLGSGYTNLTQNGVTRVGATAVAPAGADSMLAVVTVLTTDGSTVVAGEETVFDRLLIEKSATVNEYYEGTGDFTYAWTGVAGSSTSTVTAPRASGFSGNYSGRIAWQSSEGPVVGKKSVAVLSGVPNVDSFVQFDTNPFVGETLAGRTFTILATRKSSHNLAASGNDGRSWRPLWQVNSSTGSPIMIMPPAGPTTAGVHKMKYTFTFPADATTTSFARFYNGNATPNTTVWWDDVAIIEGAYPGEYFDGDTTDTADNTYLWDGTANASTSSMRGLNIKGTWFGHRAVVTASSDKPFSGSHKVKASVTEIGYFPRLVSNTFPVEAGKAYTAFAKMKCSSQPVQIALAWITVNGSSTSAIGQSASNGNWVRVSQTAIAPVDATHVQLYMGLPNSTPLNTEFEIDSIMLVAKDYDGPFGSGDTFGWEWEGTPHASTSKGYPVGLIQLAGKPLFVGTAAGQSVLTNIDPAKNPVLATNAPRTIYTIVENLKPLDTSQLDTVWVYGIDSLTDTVPNTTIILRQQSQTGNLTNALLSRRTGGGGPIILNVPASGRQILISGINETGSLFTGFNKSAVVSDSTLQMSVAHERINISPDSAYHKHVVTYIYPGVHSSAVRAEMVKLLASDWNVPGM